MPRHEVQRTTSRGAPVVYMGEDWNPTTPYYADRPGFMLTSKIVSHEVVDRLPRDGYRYVFSFASRRSTRFSPFEVGVGRRRRSAHLRGRRTP